MGLGLQKASLAAAAAELGAIEAPGLQKLRTPTPQRSRPPTAPQQQQQQKEEERQPQQQQRVETQAAKLESKDAEPAIAIYKSNIRLGVVCPADAKIFMRTTYSRDFAPRDPLPFQDLKVTNFHLIPTMPC